MDLTGGVLLSVSCVFWWQNWNPKRICVCISKTGYTPLVWRPLSKPFYLSHFDFIVNFTRSLRPVLGLPFSSTTLTLLSDFEYTENLDTVEVIIPVPVTSNLALWVQFDGFIASRLPVLTTLLVTPKCCYDFVTENMEIRTARILFPRCLRRQVLYLRSGRGFQKVIWIVTGYHRRNIVTNLNEGWYLDYKNQRECVFPYRTLPYPSSFLSLYLIFMSACRYILPINMFYAFSSTRFNYRSFHHAIIIVAV